MSIYFKYRIGTILVNMDPLRVLDEVRLLALSYGGDLYCKTKDAELLKILLDVFENQEEEMIVRGGAYAEIYRCVEELIQELPAVGKLTHH